jgi:cytoskeletal protein CcmA (bactofilin family)
VLGGALHVRAVEADKSTLIERQLHLADTVIGPELVIDGNLQSEASVRIDGRILGRIDSAATVELGAESSVTSDVRGLRVSVAGAVAGNVEAKDRVDLLAGAKLTGNVRSPRLTIADGASFRGQVDMDV